MRISLILSILLILSSSCFSETQDAATMREKIAKMLIVGFEGKNADEAGAIADLIRTEKLGGVVIFGYNVESPETLEGLCSALQNAAGYTLLIAIDQEGGRIQRLKERDGFTETPSQQWLGKKDDAGLTEKYARILSSQLKGMGINLNFAPVVDLNINPDSPIIGKYERAFSDDPVCVVRHASAFVEAHHENGVLTSLKHFPGHGNSLEDSHLGFTDITATWNESELEPYRSLIENGYNDIIMVGHLFNSEIDDEHPASLSRKTVDGLLRKKLGWNGAVVSDDMQMGAVTEHYGLVESLILSINAGVDLFIITEKKGSVSEIIDALVQAVNEGKIKAERIDESYERIKKLTERL